MSDKILMEGHETEAAFLQHENGCYAILDPYGSFRLFDNDEAMPDYRELVEQKTGFESGEFFGSEFHARLEEFQNLGFELLNETELFEPEKIKKLRVSLNEANWYSVADIDRICQLETEYLAECEKIAEQCEAEGYPANGSNYELRCENARKYYDEQLAIIDDGYEIA